MDREQIEDLKYPLKTIQELMGEARKEIGKVGCTQKTNIARGMIEFNRLMNEELGRGRYGALK